MSSMCVFVCVFCTVHSVSWAAVPNLQCCFRSWGFVDVIRFGANGGHKGHGLHHLLLGLWVRWEI